MKTGDLIRKKEEEKNNPPQETTTSTIPTAPKPEEGMNMAEARMAGNGVSEMETTIPVTQTTNTTTNPVSLYEVGKQNTGATNINSAKTSPITTPEYEKFRNEVIGAQQFEVETEEQKKKRERADFIKQGLTGLTEGLSSLANLYYTTKWAPNQKMTSQMPALQKQLYQERLERDKKLENFRAWQRAKAEKDADRAYQDKIFNINRNDRLAREAAEAKQRQENFKVQFDYKVGRDKLADQRYDEETAYKREQDEIANNIKTAQIAEQKRHNQALEGRYSTSSTSSSSRSGGKGKSDMRVIDTPKGVMDVDFNRINDTTFNQLYNKVPEDVKDMFKVGEYDDEDKRNYKMNAAISYALQNSEGYSDWLEKAGVGTYQQTPLQPKEQYANGSKWDAFDVANTGKIDFSKQKRPAGKANTAATEGTNAQVQSVGPAPNVEQPSSKPAVSETQQVPSDSGGNQFEAFFNKVDTNRANEKAKRDADMQADISNREAELGNIRDTINQYQKELDQLNSMQVPKAETEIKNRGLVGSEARELKSLVAEYRKKKEGLQKEIKELSAKEKRLQNEYAKLYSYKKR